MKDRVGFFYLFIYVYIIVDAGHGKIKTARRGEKRRAVVITCC